MKRLQSRLLKALLLTSLYLAQGSEARAVCRGPFPFFEAPRAPYLVQSCSVANGHGEVTVLGYRNAWEVEFLEWARIPEILWKTCTPDSCNAGFNLYNNACDASTKSCSVTNGSGTQAFSKGAYGACTASSCNSGYVLSAGGCYPASHACTVANGVGTQTFANGAYGACVATACASGYSMFNGACQPSNPPVVTNLSLPHQILFTLPAAISSAANPAGKNIQLTLSVKGAESITCAYVAPAGSGSYAFQGCVAPGVACAWKGCDANDSFAAGDQVSADTLSMSVPACSTPGCGLADANQVIGPENATCGATVSAAAHLLGDLSCAVTGAVLNLNADGASLNGRGHALVAPGARYGLYVQGAGDLVRNLNASGFAQGSGLSAYNAEKLAVNGNNFSGDGIGVDAYVDSAAAGHVTVTNNVIRNSVNIGLRISDEATNLVSTPVITGNDFSNSGQYAMYLHLTTASFNGLGGNVLAGSQFGIGFTGGSIALANLDLSAAGIAQTAVSVSYASTLTVTNCNFSVPGGSANQDHIGLNVYRVGQVSISGLTVSSADIAVKVATDSGVATALGITGSSIRHASLAGILLQSYDGTAFGRVTITGNDLTFNPAGQAIWIPSNVAVDPASNFSGNLQ